MGIQKNVSMNQKNKQHCLKITSTICKTITKSNKTMQTHVPPKIHLFSLPPHVSASLFALLPLSLSLALSLSLSLSLFALLPLSLSLSLTLCTSCMLHMLQIRPHLFSPRHYIRHRVISGVAVCLYTSTSTCICCPITSCSSLPLAMCRCVPFAMLSCTPRNASSAIGFCVPRTIPSSCHPRNGRTRRNGTCTLHAATSKRPQPCPPQHVRLAQTATTLQMLQALRATQESKERSPSLPTCLLQLLSWRRSTATLLLSWREAPLSYVTA